MDAKIQHGVKPYITPRWVQVWFLRRSRDNWKRKHQELKTQAKRLKNAVHDVTRSREKWRDQAEQAGRRIEELEAENAALREQAAGKKGGR
jgi:septal ring factor EnvC (AmiA/AmiB activator)